METEFFLYDGRYLTNPDRAVLYEVRNTLKQARKHAKNYGNDTVIVKVTIENNIIIKKEIVN